MTITVYPADRLKASNISTALTRPTGTTSRCQSEQSNCDCAAQHFNGITADANIGHAVAVFCRANRDVAWSTRFDALPNQVRVSDASTPVSNQLTGWCSPRLNLLRDLLHRKRT